MKVLQTLQNFLWIFDGPGDYQWAIAAPGGAPRGAQPLIRLQRIYNFGLLHAVILSFLDIL